MEPLNPTLSTALSDTATTLPDLSPHDLPKARDNSMQDPSALSTNPETNPQVASGPNRIFKDTSSGGEDVLCRFVDKVGDMGRGRPHQEGDGCFHLGRKFDVVFKPLGEGDHKASTCAYSNEIIAAVEFFPSPEPLAAGVTQFTEQPELHPDSAQIVKKIKAQTDKITTLSDGTIVLAQSSDSAWYIGSISRIQYTNDDEDKVQSVTVEHYHSDSNGSPVSSNCRPAQVKLMTLKLPCKITAEGKSVYPDLAFTKKDSVRQGRVGNLNRTHRAINNDAGESVPDTNAEKRKKQKVPQKTYKNAEGKKVKGSEEDKNHFQSRSINAARQARAEARNKTGPMEDRARADLLIREFQREADNNTGFHGLYGQAQDCFGYIMASNEEFSSLQDLTPAQIQAWRRVYVRVVRRHNGDEPRKKAGSVAQLYRRVNNKLNRNSIARVRAPVDWLESKDLEWSEDEREKDETDAPDTSTTSTATTASLPTATKVDVPAGPKASEYTDAPVSMGAGSSQSLISTTSSSAISSKAKSATGDRTSQQKARLLSEVFSADAAQPLPSTTSSTTAAPEAKAPSTAKKCKRKAKAGPQTSEVDGSRTEQQPVQPTNLPQKRRGRGAKRRKTGEDAEWVPSGGEPTTQDHRTKNVPREADLANMTEQEYREKGGALCSSCASPLFDGEVDAGIKECSLCLDDE